MSYYYLHVINKKKEIKEKKKYLTDNVSDLATCLLFSDKHKYDIWVCATFGVLWDYWDYRVAVLS